jgi:two-component system CheB/CheR fusion protein
MTAAGDGEQGLGFPLIGLGASAGGIGALQAFFRAAPSGAGVAYVVVQHLSPDVQSQLAEVLSRSCAMPVSEVVEDVAVRPDHVYVIAPDESLVFERGMLRIRPAGARPRHPIDRFFESLADGLGGRAIGVVLSGTGSNGSAGAAAIKAAGGTIFAQDPEEAGHQGMPRAVIASGAADAVLPAGALAKAAADFAQRAPGPEAEEPPDDGARARLGDLFTLLRNRLKRDFSDYKHSSVLRRTRRRMGLLAIDDLGDYVAHLERDREEMEALARDLLINVTAFFRDEGAWEALDRNVIRPLVEEADTGAALRAWTPGCATGEEAYSLAMLLLSAAEDARKDLAIKVFATDPADEALSRARLGVFSAAVAESMPPEKLGRFFDRDGEGYVAKQPLREAIVFAPQNLLSDPPFSRLDIVCCRNLLIYLQPAAQDRVLSLLHFALREDGFLFLGAAESAGERSPMFEPVMARHRIYRRIGPTRRTQLSTDQLEGPRLPTPRPGPQKATGAAERARAALVDAFAPPSVLIDHRLQTLFFHGDLSPYLTHPPGEPTQDLLRLVRTGLAARLRAAADRVLKEGAPTQFEARPTAPPGGAVVRIEVRPLRAAKDEDATRLLISFLESRGAERPPVPAPTLDESALEEALRHSREELRQTIAQLENANEALQASNEEISSINEEYQAANEELETSKEELQSLNEELNTVNAQLQSKVEELERRTSDLNNLLSSSDVATLFLDSELRIRWFTPRMRTLLSLEDTDRGRPVTDLARHFEDDAFLSDARAVLQDFQPRSSEVPAGDDAWYLRRSSPYRTEGNRVAGVVVTFVDISERRVAEESLRRSEARFRALVETSAAIVWTMDAEGRVAEDSPSWRAFTGQTTDEWLGDGDWLAAVHPEDRDRAGARFREAVTARAPLENEFRLWHAPSREWRDTAIRAAPLLEADGTVREWVGMNIDVTGERRAERRTRVLLDELQHRVKNLFANIRALHRFSRRSGGSAEATAERFEERLYALERTQDLLGQRSDETVDLRALVVVELDALGMAERARLSGDPLALPRRGAQALGLIIHELATNARKYGAAAVDGGSIQISWARLDDESPRLIFAWKERGVDLTTPPDEDGFGSELIRRTAPYMMGGEGDLRFERDGVRFSLEAHLDDPAEGSTDGADSE